MFLRVCLSLSRSTLSSIVSRLSIDLASEIATTDLLQELAQANREAAMEANQVAATIGADRGELVGMLEDAVLALEEAKEEKEAYGTEATSLIW